MAEKSSRLEDYDCEDTATPTSCGRFCGLCSRWRSPPYRYVTCQEEQEAVKDHWLLKELKKKKKKKKKKVKVLPEILLGPKWKTCFMRRLKICIGLNNKKIRRMQFTYDPKSYALNFDDGKEKEGSDGVYLDFSARYACPVGDKQGAFGIGSTMK